MSKKIVVITFIVNDDLPDDSLKHHLREGHIYYKTKGSTGYIDRFQDLGYGDAEIIVSETLMPD